ncbi:MAG: cupin domain-containing protein [Anaerolineae bacterium]|jgi:mannose-6-phosphate isomerase-like protein (cupin superfamily)
MVGYHSNVSQLTRENENFRRVLYTAKGGQLVAMSLKPSEDIGMEVHNDVDQFFWIVQGKARATLNGEDVDVAEGEVLVVPRGVNHNVTNASDSQALKLFTVYTPPEHPDGTVHRTKAEAEAAEHHH